MKIREALSEVGLQAGGGAHRLGDAVRERVGQRGQEVQAVVVGQHHVGVLGEAVLEDVAAALAEEAGEHAEAGAQHGLVVELVGQAEARHEDVLRRVVEAAVIAVQAGEGHAALEREGARRKLRESAGDVGVDVA